MSAKKRPRDEDYGENKANKKHKEGKNAEALAKCESVRKWAKDFDWAVLDKVPTFGGDEGNLFRFGKQIEKALKIIGFPKGILELEVEHENDCNDETEIFIKLQLEPSLDEQLKKMVKPNEWWSYEVIGRVTNGCFGSPVPEIFATFWRHAFVEQTREVGEDGRAVVYGIYNTVSNDGWTDFVNPVVFKPEEDDYDSDLDGDPVFECEHCVHNFVVCLGGMSRAVAKIVIDYYVYK